MCGFAPPRVEVRLEQYISVIASLKLFEGIPQEKLPQVLRGIQANVTLYNKGDMILLSESRVQAVGIVLSGHVHMLKEDTFGNRSLLVALPHGGVFGESYIAAASYIATVSFQAADECAVLFFALEKLLNDLVGEDCYPNVLLKNMLALTAAKNVELVRQLEVSTKRSLREKMLAYLSQLAQEQGTSTVVSSLGRLHLADYLGVDRSALTRELNAMCRDGLIEYEKNTYRLKGSCLFKK